MKKLMTWQQKLKQLKLQHIERTAPAFFQLSGGYRMKLAPYQEKTKGQLIRAILDWIKFSGGTAKEVIKGSFRKIDGRMQWIPARGKRVDFDILAVHGSREINIQVIKRGPADPENGHASFVGSAEGKKTVCRVTCMQDFLEWWEQSFQVELAGSSPKSSP